MSPTKKMRRKAELSVHETRWTASPSAGLTCSGKSPPPVDEAEADGSVNLAASAVYGQSPSAAPQG